MLPPVAGCAAANQPARILKYLSRAETLGQDIEIFSDYDWDLQMLMARNLQNPVFSLILNDFAPIFTAMARLYFSREKARRASREYYRELSETIKRKEGEMVERVVKNAMRQSITIWQDLQFTKG